MLNLSEKTRAYIYRALVAVGALLSVESGLASANTRTK